MRYEDDDKYLDREEDNDLWDDELEISSDPIPPVHDYTHDQTFTPQGYDDHGSNDESESEQEDDYYSDPEPAPEPDATPKSRGGRFFKKNVEDEDDDDNDFFNSDDEPAPVKKPKAPKLDPEDPDYWIEEESPLSTIIPKPQKTWRWQLAGVIAILGLIIFAWIWFFRPYADNATKYGYIRNMERRGSIIKTFEGTMIPYKELGDADPLYFQEVKFSVESDSLAAVMKRMMLGCIPVRVEYETYHAPLPWKGETSMIIIKADTADPSKILPPEYR